MSTRSRRSSPRATETPEEWEVAAGQLPVGSVELLDWPQRTKAEEARYRRELAERVARKLPLGFPIPQ